ncbi:MAG: aminoglycoside phosphotransferase family protein [Gammaproteobacteria bacterium]
MDTRLQEISQWLHQVLGHRPFVIEPASADASFRRYFRIKMQNGAHTFIVMDAPPHQEDCGPYLTVAQRLRQAGLNVPRIEAADCERGFLLLTDLGTSLYLHQLCADNADRLYGDAIAALLLMQRRAQTDQLPVYGSELVQSELALFRDWLIAHHLGLHLTTKQENWLISSCDVLSKCFSQQPRVFVHRDYHSRNLVCTGEQNPGILDFQDAVLGPITYDLVSLLRDCYIKWPEDRVNSWCRDYFRQARTLRLLSDMAEQEFTRCFDLIGVQRHLKAAGIFCRLYHRDGKSGYLQDLPRTLSYVVEIAARHPSIAALGEFVANEVVPRLEPGGA